MTESAGTIVVFYRCPFCSVAPCGRRDCKRTSFRVPATHEG